MEDSATKKTKGRKEDEGSLQKRTKVAKGARTSSNYFGRERFTCAKPFVSLIFAISRLGIFLFEESCIPTFVSNTVTEFESERLREAMEGAPLSEGPNLQFHAAIEFDTMANETIRVTTSSDKTVPFVPSRIVASPMCIRRLSARSKCKAPARHKRATVMISSTQKAADFMVVSQPTRETTVSNNCNPSRPSFPSVKDPLLSSFCIPCGQSSIPSLQNRHS